MSWCCFALALLLFVLGLLFPIVVRLPQIAVRRTSSLKLKMVAVLHVELSVLAHIPAFQLEQRPRLLHIIENGALLHVWHKRRQRL